MTSFSRLALFLVILSGVFLLSGCAGMPGAPGGQQNMPAGVLPAPGMESGGARTLMGTTVTAPDGYVLLVQFLRADSQQKRAPWRSCRRIIVLENSLVVEGVNYDGRMEDALRDTSEVLPFSKIARFSWQYKAKPVTEAEAETEAGKSAAND